MSNLKNKMIYMSEEYGSLTQLQVNEDHKVIRRDSEAEALVYKAFSEAINQIGNLEWMVNQTPYGPGRGNSETIRQAQGNIVLMKNLKKIAYRKMEDLKRTIDEVLCPKEDHTESLEIGTTENGIFLSKKTGKRKVYSEGTLTEMALKDLTGIDFEKDTPEKIAKTYVKNARDRELSDDGIVKGLGSTFRNMKDQGKVALVKAAVKKEVGFEKKKPAKKEPAKKK